jgi:hypothetical protein
MPEPNLANVVLGSDCKNLESFLFLLYKFVIYKVKQKGFRPNLIYYKLTLAEYEKIEYVIASTNSR